MEVVYLGEEAIEYTRINGTSNRSHRRKYIKRYFNSTMRKME